MGITEPFLVKVGLHKESTLSPFVFIVIIEEISKSIWKTVPWCMLFTDDIVLVAETKEEVNNNLEEWRQVLEGQGLRAYAVRKLNIYDATLMGHHRL